MLSEYNDAITGSMVQANADARRFETLFEANRADLLRFLERRLRNREDAEDALAQTFFKAWRARESFRHEASEKTWLYRIAARVVLDVQRHRQHHPAELPLLQRDGEVATDVPDTRLTPHDFILESGRSEATRDAVQSAMARLTESQLNLLKLYYFDERKYEEISEMLSIPYSQVRGRLHRIRQLLRRDMVQRQLWHPSHA